MDNELSRVDAMTARLDQAKTLYNTTEDDTAKIKLLEIITDLEEKIRQQEYKERLMAGEE